MQQGFVQVELSFWQRVYLLWTFRNFRRLSISLFSSRERALLNGLYASGETVAPDSPDPSLVIGVVDDFVPPTDRTSASPTQRQELEEVREVPSPRTESAPQLQLVLASVPRLAWSRLATAAGVLCLFAIAVVVWHRIQNGSVSQAHHQPLPRDKVTNRRDSPHARTPSALAENPPASMPVKATVRQQSALKSAVHPASMIARIPAARRRPSVQSADTIPDIPLSGQDGGIQASRAPEHLVYPEYRDIAIPGVVALTAGVDSDGAVLGVRVVSGQPALARVAIQAVRQWRYSPYFKDGEPVATQANILISFFSEDAISLDFTPERFPPPDQNLAASMPVKGTARQHAGPKSAVHRASITAPIPVAKQPPRVQSADTIPNIQFSGQDCGIQASRAPVHFVYPAYPDIPILGVVALSARVDSGGAVVSVRVVSGKPTLARAAIDAVQQWRYSPYLKDGEPVATEANILISFFSDDAISLDFSPERVPTSAQNHPPACQ